MVDSVSGMLRRADVRVDDFQIDVLCGGSQKVCFRASGTYVCHGISDDAKKAIDRAAMTPIASFYANLTTCLRHYYEEKVVPVHHADQ